MSEDLIYLTDLESVIKALYDFFDREKYTITFEQGYLIIKSNLTQTRCGSLTFNIDDKFIYLKILKKCDTSGTIFLNNLEQFAKKYEYNIKLLDASSITDYDISLANLKILTKGESWYNSKGYKSSNFENEKRHNLEFIRLPVETLRQIIINGVDKDKEQELEVNSKEFLTNHNIKLKKRHLSDKLIELIAKNEEKIENNEQILADIQIKYRLLHDKYLEIFDSIIPKTIDMTIQQFFIEIDNKIKDGSLDEDQLKWLNNLINYYVQTYILYEFNELKYSPTKRGKGNRSKKGKKRSKGKKRKSKNKYNKSKNKYNKSKNKYNKSKKRENGTKENP